MYYIIEANVNGFKYYLDKDGRLAGLQNNAYVFPNMYEAKAKFNVVRKSIIWPLSFTYIGHKHNTL